MDQGKEELVARCDAICNLQGDEKRKAVFTYLDGKKRVYHCGLGKEDCVIRHYAQKFNEVAQVAYEAERIANNPPKPLELIRF